jgi:hypothetical protein
MHSFHWSRVLLHKISFFFSPGVIADMSLDIIKEAGKFRVKHLPEEEVRVRIGMHTGPCCAGIYNLSLLFSDQQNELM